MGEIINVEARTTAIIVAEIKAAWNHVNQVALWGAVKIGIGLKELKEMVPHGQWGEYIEENLAFSQRKANQFMQIAENYGDENSAYFRAVSNSHTCANLGVSKALRLLTVPEDDVESFVGEQDIEGMTTKDLEEKIKILEAERESLRVSAVEAEAASSASEKELALLKKNGEKQAKELEKLKKAKDAEASELETQIAKVKAEAEAEAREVVSREVQAEIERLSADAETAKAAAAAARKKLEAASDERVTLFKLKVDDMQESCNAALDIIVGFHTEGSDWAEKMQKAMLQILEPMLGAVENYKALQ